MVTLLKVKCMWFFNPRNSNCLNFIGLVGCCFLIVGDAYTADLGRVANTFPIKEISPIEIIKAKYNSMTDHEKRKHNEKIIKKTRDWVARPRGAKLPRAVEARTVVFDPSIKTIRDIKVNYSELSGHEPQTADAIKKILGKDGRVLVAKGTVVNPLKIFSDPTPLLFLDGDDEKQVQWFKRQKGIAILINGEQLKFSEEIGQQVRFDQFGLLVKKFGITHVPAKVSAVNGKLLIEEIVV